MPGSKDAIPIAIAIASLREILNPALYSINQKNL